jgi:hypothetical protein
MGGKRSRQPILQLSSFVTQEDDQSTMDKSNSIPTTTFVRQSVCGSDMQKNEIGLSMVPFAKANIIFFPGDVQDFQQEM